MYIDDITDMISNKKRKISEIIFEIRSKKYHQKVHDKSGRRSSSG